MRRIITFLLIYLLALSPVACGESGTDNTAAFQPQTPQEFWNTVMGDFLERSEYRRRVETNPDEKEKGEITDLYFSGIGTDALTVSGEMTDKSNQAVSTIYGEGNLRGKGPGIATTNRVTYLKTEAEPHFSIYGLSVEEGDVEENLLNGSLKAYLTYAELTAKDDGSYTLSIPLLPEETSVLYNLDFPKSLYSVYSDVVYTADKEGRLTSVAFYLKNKEQKKTEITLSYETEAHQKPRWFNKENPFESDGASSVAVSYDLGNNETVTLSRRENTYTVHASTTDKGDGTVLVPDHIPTDVIYNTVSSNWVQNLVIPQWSSETEFNLGLNVDLFFVKGTRPEGETKDNLFFEGEWEWNNGVPKALKKR